MSQLLSPPFPLLREALDRPTSISPARSTAKSGRPACAAGPRAAYLVSRYPAVSHTFILREVLGLRARGFDLSVASINAPDRSRCSMTAEEREEHDATYYLKRHGVRGALGALGWALRHPLRSARGLRQAVTLAGGSVRQLAYQLAYWVEAQMLGRWMARSRLDHLHVHFGTAAADVALLLRLSHPITLSLTIHGPDEFYNVDGERLKAKLEAADRVICISHFARSQVMRLLPPAQWEKCDISRLGVTLPILQSQLREPGAPFTLLCVARLTPVKGQSVLLAAAKGLREQGREFRLVFVGDGPDAQRLREHASALGLEDQVLFTGPLNQPEVAAWYQRADLFVLSSFAEGIPVVLMEAMAAGLPCIASQVAGIPELIRDERDGLLVPAGDEATLARRVARVMDDPDFRQYLAAQGQQRVRAHYELGASIDRLAALFRQSWEVAR